MNYQEKRRERINPEIKTDWTLYVSKDNNPNLTVINVNARNGKFQIIGLVQGQLLTATFEQLNGLMRKLAIPEFTTSDFV